MHQQKLQQFKSNYSLLEIYTNIQHTDVTINTNKTEPFTEFNHNANYAELINSIKNFHSQQWTTLYQNPQPSIITST